MKRYFLTSLALYCLFPLATTAVKGEEVHPSDGDSVRVELGRDEGTVSTTRSDNESERATQAASSSPILADDAFQRILKYSAMLLQDDIKEPLRFAIHTPTVEEIESLLGVTACGHVCDGNVCYEDDSVANTPSPSDIQIDSIVIQDGAPPMPMLILSKPEKTAGSVNNSTAEVILNAPMTAQVKSLEVENAELKAKLAALENELELRKEYEKEIRSLLATNTELSVQVAELAATQEASEGLVTLLIEKNQLALELANLQSGAVNNVASMQEQVVDRDSYVADKIAMLVRMIEALHQDVHAINSKSIPVAKRSTLPVPLGPSKLIPADFFNNNNCKSGCATQAGSPQKDVAKPANIASEVIPSTNK